jgi:hypothetical protein
VRITVTSQGFGAEFPSARGFLIRSSSMTKTLLEDAFDHHVWARLKVMDTCDALSPEQLATAVPGTYGPILGDAEGPRCGGRLLAAGRA